MRAVVVNIVSAVERRTVHGERDVRAVKGVEQRVDDAADEEVLSARAERAHLRGESVVEIGFDVAVLVCGNGVERRARFQR